MTDDIELPKLRGREQEALLRKVLSAYDKSAGSLSYVSPVALYLPTDNGVT